MKLISRKLFLILATVFASLCLSQTLLAEPIWIDVRTAEEFSSDHIDGDLNMPLAELNTKALAREFGKDADIRLYCRSGNRAGQAQVKLEEAGFSQVSNAGGINDVRKFRPTNKVMPGKADD